MLLANWHLLTMTFCRPVKLSDTQYFWTLWTIFLGIHIRFVLHWLVKDEHVQHRKDMDTFFFVLEVLSCAIFVILRKLGRLEGAQAHLSLWTHSLSPSLSLVISLCLFMFQLHLSLSPPLQIVFSNIMNMHWQMSCVCLLNNRAVTGFPSASVLSLSDFSVHTLGDKGQPTHTFCTE